MRKARKYDSYEDYIAFQKKKTTAARQKLERHLRVFSRRILKFIVPEQSACVWAQEQDKKFWL